jgi:hypothetical protein
MPEDLEQAEAREIDTTTDTVLQAEETDEISFKYSITSYGADFLVDGLVKRIAKGDIFVPLFHRVSSIEPACAQYFSV